jgi:hypothetical protein
MPGPPGVLSERGIPGTGRGDEPTAASAYWSGQGRRIDENARCFDGSSRGLQGVLLEDRGIATGSR